MVLKMSVVEMGYAGIYKVLFYKVAHLQAATLREKVSITGAFSSV